MKVWLLLPKGIASLPPDESGIIIFPSTKKIVGRQEADIVIEDRSVSRRHAIIHNEKEYLYLSDAASKYGSFLNGNKIDSTTLLSSKDVVTFGAAQGQLIIESFEFSPYYYQLSSDVISKLSLLGFPSCSTVNVSLATHVLCHNLNLDLIKEILGCCEKTPIILCQPSIDGILDGHWNPSLLFTFADDFIMPKVLSGLSVRLDDEVASNLQLKAFIEFIVQSCGGVISDKNTCDLNLTLNQQDENLLSKNSYWTTFVFFKFARVGLFQLRDMIDGNNAMEIPMKAVNSLPSSVEKSSSDVSVESGPCLMQSRVSNQTLRSQGTLLNSGESAISVGSANFKNFRKIQKRANISNIISFEQQLSRPALANASAEKMSSKDEIPLNRVPKTEYWLQKENKPLPTEPLVIGINESSHSLMPSIAEKIQNFDSFAKTPDDLRTKTTLGGIDLVTLISVMAISLLVISEFSEFRKIEWKPEIVVDQSRKEHMTINIDISFPKVPCFAMTLDVMDAANEYQNNLIENISKMRLALNGQEIEVYEDVTINKDPGYCGSCYDANANNPDGTPICCNGCSSVFAAYDLKHLAPPEMANIDQCVAEKWGEKVRDNANEGCRVRGKFEVNKINGNFHFAPGRSYDAFNYHLHDVRFLQGMSLDFSHVIHSLSFGKAVDTKVIKNPLDGTEYIAPGKEYEFKYNVKVVPAEFNYMDGTVVSTNQYAATRFSSPIKDTRVAFPGVAFNFDISPMNVIYSEYRKPISALITGICAIIGGVYTVSAIIDAFFFHAERKLRQKTVLGKIN